MLGVRCRLTIGCAVSNVRCNRTRCSEDDCTDARGFRAIATSVPRQWSRTDLNITSGAVVQSAIIVVRLRDSLFGSTLRGLQVAK